MPGAYRPVERGDRTFRLWRVARRPTDQEGQRVRQSRTPSVSKDRQSFHRRRELACPWGSGGIELTASPSLTLEDVMAGISLVHGDGFAGVGLPAPLLPTTLRGRSLACDSTENC